MLTEHHLPVVIVFVVGIVGLEAWRRSLRHRAPRWMHIAALALIATIAGSIAYSEWAFRSAFRSVAAEDAGNKATVLARAISNALNAYACAFVAAIVAVVLLGLATWRARRMPEGGPVAQLRRK